MTDAFAEAGYGTGDIGWGRRPAVVVVDLQRAFTDSAFPLGRSPLTGAAVERAAAVLAAARAVGAPVVQTGVSYGPGQLGRWKVAGLDAITPGSAEAEIDPRVWDDRDTYVRKGYPSAFFGTDVASVLRVAEVDTVLVVGVTTSGCVRATVVDAFSHGFRTIVVTDACADHDVAAHEANLRDVSRRYADLVDAEQAVNRLRSYGTG